MPQMEPSEKEVGADERSARSNQEGSAGLQARKDQHHS